MTVQLDYSNQGATKNNKPLETSTITANLTLATNGASHGASPADVQGVQPRRFEEVFAKTLISEESPGSIEQSQQHVEGRIVPYAAQLFFSVMKGVLLVSNEKASFIWQAKISQHGKV